MTFFEDLGRTLVRANKLGLRWYGKDNNTRRRNSTPDAARSEKTRVALLQATNRGKLRTRGDAR